MAFESVNTVSLRNAINNCKTNMNNNNVIELNNKISNNNVWMNSARDNLKKAFTDLTNVKYKELTEKLDSYLMVTNYIDEYKRLQEENEYLYNRINYLRTRLYYTDTYSSVYTTALGKRIVTTRSRTVKDYGVEREMYNLNNRISNNQQRMQQLLRLIREMIY